MKNIFKKSIIIFFVGFLLLEPIITKAETLAECKKRLGPTAVFITSTIDVEGKPVTSKACTRPNADGSNLDGATGDGGLGSLIGTAFKVAFLASFGPMFIQIGSLLLTFTSLLVLIAGGLMDLSINISVIDMAKYVNNLEAINVGWGLFRDVVNMFLIFILLYISIRTIVGVGNFSPKKMITNVIIVALFINFSLFATRLVIDTSNILAVGMYNNIKTSVISGAKDEATKGKIEKTAISTAFMSPIWATSFFYTKTDEESQAKSGLGSFIGAIDNLGNNGIKMIVSTLLGSLFFLIISFVFFAATFMFVTRFVVLIFLMVLSPVAFGSLAFPGLSHWWNQWLDKLLKHAFFAPIFLFLMYFVAYFLNNNNLKETDSSFGVMLNIIIATGMMLGALTLANKFSITGSEAAREWAGKASFGLAGWAGRKSIGRAGSVVAESKLVRDMIASDSGVAKFAGRRLKSVGDYASNGTFDARGIPGASGVAKLGGGMGSISKGAKGGFDQWKKDQAKKIEEEKKFVQGLSPEEKIGVAEQEQDMIRQEKEVNTKKQQLEEDNKLIKQYDEHIEEVVSNDKDINALREAKKILEQQKADRKEELEDLLELAKLKGDEDKTQKARGNLRNAMAAFDVDIATKQDEIDNKIEDVSNNYKIAVNYADAEAVLKNTKAELETAENNLNITKEAIKAIKQVATDRKDTYIGKVVIENGKVVNENTAGEESTGLSKRTFASTLFGTTSVQREQAMRFLSPDYEKEQEETKKLKALAKQVADAGKDEKKEDKKPESSTSSGEGASAGGPKSSKP